MNIWERMRSILSSVGRRRREPVGDGAFGDPSATLMSRGEGELGEAHDAQHAVIRRHAFGSPNDSIEDRVRPPVS
jgi:hypothetical protein